MKIQPYLFFEGRCEEAIEHYRKTLGAEVTALLRFSEHPGSCAPGNEDKIMHSAFRIGETEVMASDGMTSGNPNFQGVSLALTVPDPATADRHFNALADGGQIQMPLTTTFFSPSFGMVADRFGVSWMIMAEPAA